MRGTTTCYLVYIFHDCSHAVPPRTLERGSRRNIGSIVVVAACNAATAVAAIGTRVLKKRRKKKQGTCTSAVRTSARAYPEYARDAEKAETGDRWWMVGAWDLPPSPSNSRATRTAAVPAPSNGLTFLYNTGTTVTTAVLDINTRKQNSLPRHRTSTAVVYHGIYTLPVRYYR